MRSMLLALSCLAVGALGALGYSHYLGEGKQLAELQAELSAANANLAKVTQNNQQAKSETDAMSTQIQQLTSTKEDLKKQLDELKSATPETAATPSAANPFAGMSGMMKARMVQHVQEQLLLLKL